MRSTLLPDSRPAVNKVARRNARTMSSVAHVTMLLSVAALIVGIPTSGVYLLIERMGSPGVCSHWLLIPLIVISSFGGAYFAPGLFLRICGYGDNIYEFSSSELPLTARPLRYIGLMTGAAWQIPACLFLEWLCPSENSPLFFLWVAGVPAMIAHEAAPGWLMLWIFGVLFAIALR